MKWYNSYIMGRFFQDKRWIIALSVIALLALTVLSISLREMEFHEAQIFRQQEAEQIQVSLEDIVQAWIEIPWWKQAGVWILLLMLIVLVASLLSPELRKRLILTFIRIALTFWGFYILFRNYGSLIPALNLNLQEGGLSQEIDSASLPPPVFEPPRISPLVSYLVSFGIVVLAIGLVWGLNHFWAGYKVWRDQQRPLEAIAKIARTTLSQLTAGKDSDDVIVNCYLQMSQVVGTRRNLVRQDSMTPTEFASRLEQAGLPGDAVRRLTRLFESVRYGGNKATQSEVNEAVTCLTAILHYCGEPV